MTTVHNALARFTALSRGYAKALGLLDGGLERAGETLTPTMPIFEQPEWRYPCGELMGIYYAATAAGGAGQFGGFGVGLAAGSPLKMIVEAGTQINDIFSAHGVYLCTIAQLTSNFTTAELPVPIDSRQYKAAGTIGGIVAQRGTTSVVPGAILGQLYTDPTTGVRETAHGLGCLPVVLFGGYSIVIRSLSANQAVTGQIRFRVSEALPGELNA